MVMVAAAWTPDWSHRPWSLYGREYVRARSITAYAATTPGMRQAALKGTKGIVCASARGKGYQVAPAELSSNKITERNLMSNPLAPQIAIVATGALLPGSVGIDEFWASVLTSRDLITD